MSLRLGAAAIALVALAPSTSAQSSDSDNVDVFRGGSATAATATSRAEDGSAVVRLKDGSTDGQAANRRNRTDGNEEGVLGEPQKRYVPGEFELFVNRLAKSGEVQQKRTEQTPENSSRDQRGRQVEEPLPIRRFGAELVTGMRSTGQDYAPQVPPDYLVSPGDELVLTLWGSVDANLRLVVDRAGRITIPRVGAVMVSGVRYGDLPSVIKQQVGQVFKNFQLSVSLGQLRNVRIYVTGFTQQPGSYTVSSLSTIVNALMRTGGPSSAGSFRNVELYREGKRVTTFDLYDLLLRGDKSGDRVLQAEDVIQIGPVGPQVALIGSVNKPAIFELKNGETVEDVLRMAAGFSAVADRSRLAVERLVDRDNVRVTQLSLPADLKLQPSSGDVLRAFSVVDVALPVQRQNKRVRVEGEVAHPGEYILPAQSSINDALKAAGGLTPNAYLFGTEFNRESVRATQQDNYERALRDLETEFTRTTSTQRVTTADEAAALSGRSQATSRLVERLRAVKPTGRIVLQVPPGASSLPDLALEDGDRLYVPPRPTTVGVFGSVFNGGTYLFGEGRTLSSYLKLAGGPTRGADADSTFVIRANGAVVSARQSEGWFGISGFSDITAEPGDTIFVPEEINKTTFVQNAKDWTQILYQFGLGIAAIRTLR
jgi:protein involved in polysaccharide export with SLBB domain